ncbi:MAG: CatA-like O-acetyltransferase [Candidatus Competibacteraceae bacterium]
MRRKIELDTYPRRKVFDVFKDHAVPYFSITSAVEITGFKEFIAQQGYGFFMSLSFLIANAVNRIPALRQRLIQGELIEWSRVDPSFTVLLEDETFCFCQCPYAQ